MNHPHTADNAPDYELPGNADSTPDEVSVFMSQLGIAEKYQCILKQVPEGGGKPQILRVYNNNHPDVDTVGKHWGPGTYVWVLSWKQEGPNGKKQPVASEFELTLAEKAYREMHMDYLLEQAERKSAEDKQRIEQKRRQAELENAGKTHQERDGVEELRRAASVLKELGVSVGGAPVPAAGAGNDLVMLMLKMQMEQAEQRRRDDLEHQRHLAQMQLEASKQQMTLFGFVLEAIRGTKAENDPLSTKFTERMMDMVQKTLEIKELMKPEEKETMVDKIFNMVSGALPQIMELAQMNAKTRQQNFIYKVASGSKEMQAVRANPELQVAMVQKLDEHYGFQTTNEVLKVAGIPRPAATAENWKLYPSDGYTKTGQPVEDVDSDAADAEDGDDEDDEMG